MSTKSTLPFIDYAAVKAATSIEMVLHHYGVLESPQPEQQETIRCRCPIHQGTDDSEFSVNLAKNLWRCFSPACNAGGNHLDLVARIEDCTLHEAAWRMNEWFALGHEKSAKPRPRSGQPATPSTSRPSPKPVPSRVAKKQEAAPVEARTEANPMEEAGENKPLAFSLQNLDPTHPYLAERGLNAETIAEFGLGFCPKGILAGRIAIPIHNAAGELIANAGRWPGEPPEGKDKYRLPGGFKKSLELFNAHRAFAEPVGLPLVIVGSYFPVFQFWSRGFSRVVALMGTALSAKQEELIQSHVPPAGRILLLLGNGPEDKEARLQIAARLAEHCFVRAFPLTENIRPSELL